jgi:hypothetical protein
MQSSNRHDMADSVCDTSEIQDAMIDAMIRLEKALKPHIESL